MNDLDILFLVVPANVVGLSQTSLLLYHVNALGMVVYIQPVADVLAVSIDRKLLALQRVVDDQRNQLLRKLIGAVIVRAIGNIGRKFVGIDVRFNQKIRAGLAGGIGTVRIIRRRLIEKCMRIIHAT